MKRPVRILLTVVAVIAVIVCIFCILFIVQYVRGKSVSDKLGSGVRSGQVVEPLDPRTTANIWPSMWTLTASTTSIRKSTPGSRCPAPTSTTPWSRVQQTTCFTTITGWIGPITPAAAFFSQRYNTTTFQDPVTVLYGHNRQSQTMFAQVNNFADAAFFAKNQKIFVYTPDKVYEYTIFAAYPHSSEHLLLCHDFTDSQQFADYFASLGRPSTPTTAGSCFPRPGTRC